MPTYEFKCLSCGHRFERFLRITDNSRLNCPICDSHAERMISSGGGLILKGSGFYQNDYRKSSTKADEKK